MNLAVLEAEEAARVQHLLLREVLRQEAEADVVVGLDGDGGLQLLKGLLRCVRPKVEDPFAALVPRMKGT